MNITEATKITGAKASEILEIADSPAGDIIYMSDRTVMIVVPDDTPDADGKTGLMYLVAPHDPYFGTMPVYAQPVEDAAAEADPEGDGLDDLTVKELHAIAAEREVALGDARTKPAIIEAIRAAAEADPEGDGGQA